MFLMLVPNLVCGVPPIKLLICCLSSEDYSPNVARAVHTCLQLCTVFLSLKYTIYLIELQCLS